MNVTGNLLLIEKDIIFTGFCEKPEILDIATATDADELSTPATLHRVVPEECTHGIPTSSNTADAQSVEELNQVILNNSETSDANVVEDLNRVTVVNPSISDADVIEELDRVIPTNSNTTDANADDGSSAILDALFPTWREYKDDPEAGAEAIRLFFRNAHAPRPESSPGSIPTTNESCTSLTSVPEPQDPEMETAATGDTVNRENNLGSTSNVNRTKRKKTKKKSKGKNPETTTTVQRPETSGNTVAPSSTQPLEGESWTVVARRGGLKPTKKVLERASILRDESLKKAAVSFLSAPASLFNSSGQQRRNPATEPKNFAEQNSGLRQIYISGKQVIGFGENRKGKLPYSVLRKQLSELGIYSNTIKDIQYCGQVIQLTVREAAVVPIQQIVAKYEGAIALEPDFDPATNNGLVRQTNVEETKARFISRCVYQSVNSKYTNIRKFYIDLLTERYPEALAQDTPMSGNVEQAVGLNNE
jgi:hypothetical protein